MMIQHCPLVLQCALKSPSETASLKVRKSVLTHTALSHKKAPFKKCNHHSCLRVRHDGSVRSDPASPLLRGGRGSRAFCLQHPPHLHCVQRCPADTEHQVRHSIFLVILILILIYFIYLCTQHKIGNSLLPLSFSQQY